MSSVELLTVGGVEDALLEADRARLDAVDEVLHDERLRPHVFRETAPHALGGPEAGVEHRRQILVHLPRMEDRQGEERRRTEAHESTELSELALADPGEGGYERTDNQPVATLGGRNAQSPQQLIGCGDGRQRREGEEDASTEKSKRVAHEVAKPLLTGFPWAHSQAAHGPDRATYGCGGGGKPGASQSRRISRDFCS